MVQNVTFLSISKPISGLTPVGCDLLLPPYTCLIVGYPIAERPFHQYLHSQLVDLVLWFLCGFLIDCVDIWSFFYMGAYVHIHIPTYMHMDYWIPSHMKE